MTDMGAFAPVTGFFLEHALMFAKGTQPIGAWLSHDELISMIEELAAFRSDAHTNGEVKALEWLSDAAPFTAYTPFCYYRIEHADDDTGPHWQTTIHYTGSTYMRRDSLDEAKSAAQADFETRIRSALSLGHPIQGEADDLEHAQRAYDILVSGDPPFTARECRASYALTYIPGMRLSPQPPTPAGVREITDEAVKRATIEFLSHKGERPMRVTRGGWELWEGSADAMRAALAAAREPGS